MDDFEAAFQHVVELARAVAPGATVGVSYGAPSLIVDGKALIGVSQGAEHLSLIPFSPLTIDAVRADLAGFVASKGVIRFTPDHPLPDALILRLVHLRLAEIRPT